MAEMSPQGDIRKTIRRSAAICLLIGIAALAFDILSGSPAQSRYAPGALLLAGFSAATFYFARG